MGVYKQKSEGKGSLKDIQILVNENLNTLNNLIKRKLDSFANDDIVWLSPLKNDCFSEYKDNDFLIKLGLDPNEIQLEEFWPQNGPQWDALAKTNNGKIILVEAKANIPELASSSTRATGKSKNLIIKSLNETKCFLNITDDVDWSGKYYQYTNRIAHLFFLRERCQKDVFLINIYFVGDETVNGPKTIAEWKGAIRELKTYLGIHRHRLSEYMCDIFIHVNELITE